MLLLSPFLLLLLQCAYLCIYLFTAVCLEESQIFGWRILPKLLTAMAVGYFRKGFCLECLIGFSMCLKIISFILFINYSRIALSFYSFTSLFINLCVCFKSVYTGRFLLLFPSVCMFYHFCLRNLYMKTFVRAFFNLLIKL